MFHKAGGIENWGTGFYRISEACKENGNPQPLFEVKAGAFVIIIKPVKLENVSGTTQKTDQKTDQETDQKTDEEIILELIKNNNKITIKEISIKINKGLTVTKERINKLKEQNKIQRIGPDKGGHWEVKDL